MSRTSTLVSTARMAFLDVFPDSGLYGTNTSSSGRLGKQRAMNFFGGKAARLANHDPVAVFIPLQHRSGTNTEALANLGRNRDLTLSRQLRMREGHTPYYHGNGLRLTLEGGPGRP